MVTLGSVWTCNQRQVDAVEHYTRRLEEIDIKIREIQEQAKKMNLGIAFISFKDKECVYETLDEIELVRQRMLDDQANVRLGL